MSSSPALCRRKHEAQLTFIANAEKKVTELILHQNGRNMPASRVR